MIGSDLYPNRPFGRLSEGSVNSIKKAIKSILLVIFMSVFILAFVFNFILVDNIVID